MKGLKVYSWVFSITNCFNWRLCAGSGSKRRGHVREFGIGATPSKTNGSRSSNTAEQALLASEEQHGLLESQYDGS